MNFRGPLLSIICAVAAATAAVVAMEMSLLEYKIGQMRLACQVGHVVPCAL